MNHTPESLLDLTKSPEGLEQLRIIAAQFDGNKRQVCCKIWWNEALEEHFLSYELPNYHTSLDAIFAAEERLGLHKRDNKALRKKWHNLLHYVVELTLTGNVYTTPGVEVVDIASLPPPLRLIVYILTAQWKEQNP